MNWRLPSIVATVTAAITLVLAGPAAAATLKAEYRLDNTLAPSFGQAPSLVPIETNGANRFATETALGNSGSVMTFPQGNGLQVSTVGVIPPTTYTIVVDFRLTDVSGYRRILDFKNATSDNGLYDLDGQLVFYSTANGSQSPPPITPSAHGDPYHEVTLSRDDSGQVIGTVDGSEQFRFDDTASDATLDPDQILRFFKDDNATPGEESAGAVSDIRLYDGPLPPPVIGRQVDVSPVRGTVLVALPGGHFAPLTGGQQIPVGATVDTRHGTVSLTSAANLAGATQNGDFSGAVFKIVQQRAAKAVTELRLAGGSFAACTRARRASAARSLPRRTVRSLHGSARGRYRTSGRYSSATVHGTDWTVTDRCDGTLTSVRQGAVLVNDFRRHRTITVRAGHSYLARAR